MLIREKLPAMTGFMSYNKDYKPVGGAPVELSKLAIDTSELIAPKTSPDKTPPDIAPKQEQSVAPNVVPQTEVPSSPEPIKEEVPPVQQNHGNLTDKENM